MGKSPSPLSPTAKTMHNSIKWKGDENGREVTRSVEEEGRMTVGRVERNGMNVEEWEEWERKVMEDVGKRKV